MQGDSLSPRGGEFGMQTHGSAAAADEVVDSLPFTLGVLEAARYLGIGRTTAYALIAAGELPVPVLRVGRSYRVPTAPLLELLGLRSDAASRESAVAEPVYCSCGGR
jgi:excisionase family DNA binding protein